MVKKQSASKTPTKHASQKDKGKKDDSNASSLAIQKPHFWNMNLLPERGYEMTKATPSFLSTVANLHWDHFVLPRIGYNEEIVREFYAGITEVEGPKKTYTSQVRGKIVQFHPRKINEHFMLKYNGFDFEKRVGYSSMREMEEVRNRIATPNSVWEKFSANEIKLRSTYLINALGNWHLFICTSILPTSHTYAMTKERLILLDTILSEGNVDIGRLIAREIYTCITKTKGFLFFPCLITELCMKAAVPIAANEHTKFLSNNLRADMKERMRKEKGPQPMPMPKPMPAMQEHFMQKQAAVWKFQKEQHDWLQLVIQYMSTELGHIEAPVFPSWVLRTEGKEDEEKEEADEENEEKEEEADREVEEEEEQKLRKKVTRKQAKGKKKVVIEPELEETYDSDSEENLELEKEMNKESEEEEEESDEPGSEEEERARNVIVEEIARQKYTSPTKSPAKSPTESPITSPTKEPSPPSKSPPIQPPVQSPPHSPPPPYPTKPEQPMPQSPSIITANVISDLEKEIVQEKEEEGLNRETEEEDPSEKEESEAEAEPEEVQSDAPAPGASASQKTATTKHDETIIKLVLEEMAKSKKEELGNTQKFFKTPALKKQAAKRKISEAKSTDATASVPASTTKETGASAPTEETPTKPSKEKKLKVKHTAPTRQSSRTRSGAKK